MVELWSGEKPLARMGDDEYEVPGGGTGYGGRRAWGAHGMAAHGMGAHCMGPTWDRRVGAVGGI